MTTHTTTSLTVFLLTRIEEDEAAAKANRPDWEADDAFEQERLHDLQPHHSRCGWRLGEGLDRECTCGYPARVLAEVKAHRAVVEEHEMMPARQSSLGTMHLQDGRQLSTYYVDGCCSTCTAGGEYGDHADPETGALDYCPTLRILASIYSAHPDYDESWRP